MGVPASVNKAGNPQMVGEVLELLGYYTGTVKTAYYELQLGAKVSEAQEDADMSGYHLEIAGQRYRAGLLQLQWQHG